LREGRLIRHAGHRVCTGVLREEASLVKAEGGGPTHQGRRDWLEIHIRNVAGFRRRLAGGAVDERPHLLHGGKNSAGRPRAPGSLSFTLLPRGASAQTAPVLSWAEEQTSRVWPTVQDQLLQKRREVEDMGMQRILPRPGLSFNSSSSSPSSLFPSPSSLFLPPNLPSFTSLTSFFASSL
jgi:hypothetical protein